MRIHKQWTVCLENKTTLTDEALTECAHNNSTMISFSSLVIIGQMMQSVVAAILYTITTTKIHTLKMKRTVASKGRISHREHWNEDGHSCRE